MLDNELLVAGFGKHIEVHAVLPSEEEHEPKPYDEVLSNELYRLEFIDPDSCLERAHSALTGLSSQC